MAQTTEELKQSGDYLGMTPPPSFTDDGTWREGVSMGAKINSEKREIYPRVSPDGKYIFYSSNKTGNWEIYWCTTKIIEKLKPAK